MMEIWKDIPKYEGKYQISSKGRIKSLPRKFRHRETILKPIKKENGYIQHTLIDKNYKSKCELLHRLIAISFIPNPENKPQINHKDGNPSNNNIDNLEWCTASENGIHSYRVLGNKNWCEGLFSKNHPTSRPVVQMDMKDNMIKIWDSGMDAVREGFDSSSITRCCQGKYRHHKGFKWKYL